MLDSSFALLLMDRIATVHSLVYGTPTENCQSMLPQHDNYLPQWMDPSPYNLSASIILDSTSNSSDQYNVTLIAERRRTFKGFFIQARSLTDHKIIGSFDPVKDPDVAKLIDCPGGTQIQVSDLQNAATHVINYPKSVVNFVWKPPANFEGKFYFEATVVAEYKVFWTGIETPPFNITKTGQ
ncbi:hypothetical protein DAPPUDRAFT_321230 [Daphnia pulex]|uniref:Reelin domain-containing protein n=1 Tax=Daphnia pulex TaxID=6669 RepID=E9GSC0_DAPPU|nr:hypothetical protein DAPPUDRAFT_321230 [Daphnia pulex]|eukprot:EFX77694.1 hypothetical protein DAPPUDRAFT_321230 [Daphnia pulex]